MQSYEWMELQTLTAEIATTRSRLVAARSKRDQGRIRALQEEITAAEARRDRLLAYISTNLAKVPENVRPPEGIEGTKLREALASAAAVDETEWDQAAAEQRTTEPEDQAVAAPEPFQEEAEEEPRLTEPADLVIASAAAAPASTPEADITRGGFMAWDQLTPVDIERAKHEIGVQRAEMLSRHAEELRALEADQTQVEGLEQAVAAFFQKLGKAEVVKLDEQRELRQQGG